ncbi:hypothetical protein Hanom_Chr07g00655071 [Helianthus anomalus]
MNNIHVSRGFVIINNSPNAEEIGRGGEEIGFLALFVGYKDDFGGWVWVFEGEGGVGSDLTGGVVELDDFDPVRVLFEEAGDGETVLFVAADAPVHGVDVPWGFVGVDLGAALLLVGVVVVVVAVGTHWKGDWWGWG